MSKTIQIESLKTLIIKELAPLYIEAEEKLMNSDVQHHEAALDEFMNLIRTCAQVPFAIRDVLRLVDVEKARRAVEEYLLELPEGVSEEYECDNCLEFQDTFTDITQTTTDAAHAVIEKRCELRGVDVLKKRRRLKYD